MNQGKKHEFQETVWAYYAEHGRHDLPWRQPEADGNFDPYKVLVSEIMLQQTQVQRVIPKFQEFLIRFPSSADVATAPLSEVLILWSGLGYNRRAKFLWEATRLVETEFDGEYPKHVKDLMRLSGVGPNTAGAIAAYAFNQPTVFIETNIRTVYIHHFFDDETEVSDAALRPYIETTLSHEQPREWYWALMDYGTHLKQTIGNLNKLSVHYVKQSTFAGSRRQIRGQIIRELGQKPLSLQALQAAVTDERLESILDDLLQEEMIRKTGDRFTL